MMRSIPASAGEPGSCSPIKGRYRVYPRECGGTTGVFLRSMIKRGLSPRVRGNPLPYADAPAYVGSIPASAGEPTAQSLAGMTIQVYPRECGGTLSLWLFPK